MFLKEGHIDSFLGHETTHCNWYMLEWIFSEWTRSASYLDIDCIKRTVPTSCIYKSDRNIVYFLIHSLMRANRFWIIFITRCVELNQCRKPVRELSNFNYYVFSVDFSLIYCIYIYIYTYIYIYIYIYIPTPPLEQGMTKVQFLSGV